MSVNSKVPPLDNPKLKQAMALAVDRDTLIKSLWRLYQVDTGFHTQGVLKAEFQLSSRYPQRMRDWTAARAAEQKQRRADGGTGA